MIYYQAGFERRYQKLAPQQRSRVDAAANLVGFLNPLCGASRCRTKPST